MFLFQIWEALIPSMPIPQIITYLPKLHKYGFFRGNCPVQSKVVEALNNPDKIKESKIYPSEVFIGIKNFEKGGKYVFFYNNLYFPMPLSLLLIYISQ